MRKKQIARSATVLLVIIWLLSGVSIISIAENIPISEEGLERIGLNKIRLESGIGVIVFNLSESSSRLKGSGYLTLSNTYNSSAIISCRVVTRLSVVDLNEDGTPRLHKTISNNIIFYPIPDSSWITLEDDKAVINPCSIYNFRYTVDIPLEKVDVESPYFDVDKGYLLYINVRKTIENASGAQIGIDYNYKLFLVFTGELEQVKEGFVFSAWMLIPILIVGGMLYIAVYKQKRKKDPSKIKETEFPLEIKRTKSHITKAKDDTLLHQEIDKLTGMGDNREVNWGKDV